MASRLNQIIALEKGTKQRTNERMSEARSRLTAPQLLTGLSRTYVPKDEEGQQLPSESQRVQVRSEQVITDAQAHLIELFDVTATKDWANCIAKADVVVEGKPLLKDVPATYLLFLEKQLVELRAFVSSLPVLDPAEEWKVDGNSGVYKTEAVQSLRTQKVPKTHVIFEPTKDQPGQGQVFTEDVPVGTWTVVKFSGALPETRVRQLLARIDGLDKAVKTAREEANMTEAAPVKVGESFFIYLFGA